MRASESLLYRSSEIFLHSLRENLLYQPIEWKKKKFINYIGYEREDLNVSQILEIKKFYWRERNLQSFVSIKKLYVIKVI